VTLALLVVGIVLLAGSSVSAAEDGWSDWTPCTRLCGLGDTYRSCVTPALGCDGINHDRCNPTPCVNCTVTPYWTGYSGCSKTCGGGTYWRSVSVIQYPEPGGTPCPPLNYTYDCNTDMCYTDMQGYGFYFWGPFTGPGPLSYTIARVQYALDVFLFDQQNFIQYQYDVQRPKPYQTNYAPIRSSLDIETVKSEGPIALSTTTNYYLVVDNTNIGAVGGTTDNNGNQVFTPVRFYYAVTGLDPGPGYQSSQFMSAASPVAQISTLAVAFIAIASALLL